MAPKPYKFTGFGDIHGPKPYKIIGFGDIHGPKGNLAGFFWEVRFWGLAARKSPQKGGWRHPSHFEGLSRAGLISGAAGTAKTNRVDLRGLVAKFGRQTGEAPLLLEGPPGPPGPPTSVRPCLRPPEALPGPPMVPEAFPAPAAPRAVHKSEIPAKARPRYNPTY